MTPIPIGIDVFFAGVCATVLVWLGRVVNDGAGVGIVVITGIVVATGVDECFSGFRV
jgi:hypothetical protein